MISLQSIPLPDGMRWVDELDYCAIKQTQDTSITGRLLLDRAEMQDGRPITLRGFDNAWPTWALLVQLGALRAIPTLLDLIINGTTYKVRFDYAAKDHFFATALIPTDEPPQDDDKYTDLTLKFFEVID